MTQILHALPAREYATGDGAEEQFQPFSQEALEATCTGCPTSDAEGEASQRLRVLAKFFNDFNESASSDTNSTASEPDTFLSHEQATTADIFYVNDEDYSDVSHGTPAKAFEWLDGIDSSVATSECDMPQSQEQVLLGLLDTHVLTEAGSTASELQIAEDRCVADPVNVSAPAEGCALLLEHLSCETDGGIQRDRAMDYLRMRGQIPEVADLLGLVVLEHLSCKTDGGIQRDRAMFYLRMGGHFLQHSFTKDGGRAVQLALEHADNADAASLVSQLHGYVQEALQNRHGNYVLQKIVKRLPGAKGSFVAKELRGVAAWAAEHEYGCRVLCRIYEHCAASEDAIALSDELMPVVGKLSLHKYGHHVVEAILKNGAEVHRCQIGAVLCRNVKSFVRDKNGSFVIETALECCEESQRQTLSDLCLAEGPASLANRVSTSQGIGYVKALVKQQLLGQEYLDQLLHLRGTLRKSNHGKRLLEEVESVVAATQQ